MGRTVKSKYRVEFDTLSGHMTPSCWRTKIHGRATADNLAKYAEHLNASFLPGGVNEHVGVDGTILFAYLIRQSDGEVIARWEGVDAEEPAIVVAS